MIRFVRVREDSLPRPVVDEDAGGDAACWLQSVCPECGRVCEDRAASVCPSCGADLPTG